MGENMCETSKERDLPFLDFSLLFSLVAVAVFVVWDIIKKRLPGGTIHWPSAPLGLWLDPATTVPLGTLATDGQGVGIFETDVPPGLRAGDRFVIQAALWNDREVEASLPVLWQVGG